MGYEERMTQAAGELKLLEARYSAGLQDLCDKINEQKAVIIRFHLSGMLKAVAAWQARSSSEKLLQEKLFLKTQICVQRKAIEQATAKSDSLQLQVSDLQASL